MAHSKPRSHKSSKIPDQQGKNRDYAVGYKKPPKSTQFKPGQSGNPKGRPKSHDELRELIQEIAGRTLPSSDRTLVEDMILNMFEGRDSRDHQNVLEHGWGKVKEEHELHGKDGAPLGGAAVTIYLPDNGRGDAPPAGATDPIPEQSR